MRSFTNLLVFAAMFFFALASVHAADPALKADAQQVNTACATDAATAKCGNEKVGSGLLKCLHLYKKANPSYKFSSTCIKAMQQMRSDKKAGK